MSASSVRARSMSSSVASVDIIVPNHHFLTSTRAHRPCGTPQEQPAAKAEIARLRVQVAKLTKELKGIKGSVPHRHLGLDASISVIGRGACTLDRLTALVGKRGGSGTDKQGGGSRLIWAGVALSFIFQAIDVAAG